MGHGKHVIVEKPLALTLADCDRVVAAAESSRPMQLIVGHTHGFDLNIREMRRIIRSGELGRLGMILALNYYDFLTAAAPADEFDTARGGGIAVQSAHAPDRDRPHARRRLVRSVRANAGGAGAAAADRRPLLGVARLRGRRRGVAGVQFL